MMGGRALLPWTLVAALLGGALAAPVEASVLAANFSETTVASGLAAPTAIVFLPDGRFLVTQLSGELLLGSGGTPTLLATIPVCSPGASDFEIGLLGIALHPDFPTDRTLFLYRTSPSSTSCDLGAPDRVNQVIRVTLGADDTVSLASLVVLLDGIRTDTGYHNGGGLRVGPDRRLYVGVGDTGLGDPELPPGNSTNPYAQDLGALEGKILRLGLDGSIPADNPFVATPGARGEVFAYGFRNPFRFGFDPVTKALWVGDVGEETVEEIDRVAAGANHGWPRCEGALPAGCAQPGDATPAFTYPHDGPGSLGNSVTGGAFAAGGVFAALNGRYFFGDYGKQPTGGAIYMASLDAAGTGFAGAPEPVVSEAEGPVDVVFAPDGALHYVAIRAGAVRRVVTSLIARCTTIGTCRTDLAPTLPDPSAVTGKVRRTARMLAKLARTAGKTLDRAARAKPRKQRPLYRAARKTLGRLLSMARKANDKGQLGVPLPPLEDAVQALLAVIPT
jgi:glucose/arabinose dehydrogenase